MVRRILAGVVVTTMMLTCLTSCGLFHKKETETVLKDNTNLRVKEEYTEEIDKTVVQEEIKRIEDEKLKQIELEQELERQRLQEELSKTPEEIAKALGAGSEKCLQVFGDMYADLKKEESLIQPNKQTNIRDYYLYTSYMREEAIEEVKNRRAWASEDNTEPATEDISFSDIANYFIIVPVVDWEAENKSIGRDYTYDFGEYPLEQFIDNDQDFHEMFGYKVYQNNSDKSYKYELEATVEIELIDDIFETEDYKSTSCRYMRYNRDNPYRTKSDSQELKGLIKNNYSGSTIGSYDISNSSKVRAMSSSTNLFKPVKDNYGVNITVTMYGNVKSLEDKDIDSTADSSLAKQVKELEETIWKTFDLDDEAESISKSSVIKASALDD